VIPIELDKESQQYHITSKKKKSDPSAAETSFSIESSEGSSLKDFDEKVQRVLIKHKKKR